MHKPWTKQELRLLGTAGDDEIAARLGRTTIAVRRKRRISGIAAAAVARGYQKWTPYQDSLLGTDTDEVIARRLRRTVTAIIVRRQRMKISKYRRWTDAELSLLGTATDREVAAEIGAREWEVRYQRRKLGLRGGRFPRRRRSRIDWDSVNLADRAADIAERLGCSRQAVYNARARRSAVG